MNVTVDYESIERWIADDPDPQTAQSLSELLAQARSGNPQAQADLASQCGEFLQFGTAGLRGALGAGPSRMNRAVVIRTAAGLMQFLNKQVVGPRVVIGFDARYGSEQFAADTADVVGKFGGHALLLPRPLPTPVLAYAVRALEADAGVMVTASHNPPEDNGYKVYLGGRVLQGEGQGAQIVEPYDTQIATEIAAITSAKAVLAREITGQVEPLGEEVWEAYLDAVHALADDGPRDLKIVTTAMHGVGDETLQRVLSRAGFHRVTSVPEQAQPDPDFPTVNFPNPEEPGALDLAMKTAERAGADLIIANDPDADRCSAAIPDAASPTGWRQLSGDEIGAILGYYTAQQYAKTPSASSQQDAESDQVPVLASSIVSSRILGKIATDHGLEHRATLTGFKWIARAPRLLFGYEEAIGYCVAPDLVRDKDGISAGLVLAMVAAQYQAQGKTLADVLDEIALRYGLYATAPLSIRVADLSVIEQGMANLRANPPQELVGSPVAEFVDLAQGSEDLPPTNGILVRTAADDRVIVRPSGTEPKLKCYLEVVIPTQGDIAAARSEAETRLTALSAQIRTILGI